MFSRVNAFKKIIKVFLFITAVFITDWLFIQGKTELPRIKEIAVEQGTDGASIFTYAFNPFYEFRGEVPDFPSEGHWIYSHPMGIGNYRKIVSIALYNPSDYEEVQCQTVYNFYDAYRKTVFWEKLNPAGGEFLNKMNRKAPFLQLRVMMKHKQKFKPSQVIVRVKAESPIGLPGIFNPAALRASDLKSNDEDVYSPFFHKQLLSEKPFRRVVINPTFSTYRMVNLLNGLNCNVIGELQLGNCTAGRLIEAIRINKDSIKVWRLTGTDAAIRETAEKIVSAIYENSSGAYIFWENNGIRVEDALGNTRSTDSTPVKLNRGTLWTGVIIFSILYLIAGTIKVFNINFSFKKNEMMHRWKNIVLCGLVFLLPGIFESFMPVFSFYLVKLLILTTILTFIIEFCRAVLLKSFEVLLSYKKSKNQHRKKNLSSILPVFITALFISFLYAGYPGFSPSGAAVLLLSNFINGIYFTSLMAKGKSVVFVFLLHLITVLPATILIGI